MTTKVLRRAIALGFLAIFAVTSARFASAQGAPDRPTLTRAVAELRTWLSRSGHAAAWQRYLALDRLQAELAKEGDANSETLSQILAQFDVSHPAMAHPQFSRVRNLLRRELLALPAVAPADLAAAARQAKESFRAVDEAQFRAASDRVKATMTALDRFLARDPAKAAGWKRYLKWDELQAELAAGANGKGATLQSITHRYQGTEKGKSLQQFADVENALKSYTAILGALRNDKAQADFEARVEALAAILEKAPERLTDDQARAMREHLSRLAADQQANRVARLLHSQYSHPNLVMQMTEEIVGAGIVNPINDVMPVTDVILGTRIRGTANTLGQTSINLLPNGETAQFDTMLNGTAYSNTVGVNGPATIRSSGVTTLYGVKRTIINSDGFTGNPGQASAQTRTTIQGIGVSSKMFRNLIQKVATKRVYESKGQAERIAGVHAAQRLQQRLDREAVNFLANANRGFYDKFRNPLLRYNAFPQMVQFSTTADHLFLTGLQADPIQLAAPTPAPEIDAHEVTVRLHESAIDNMAASALSGRRMTREDFRQIMLSYAGKVPPEFDTDPDEVPEEEEGDAKAADAPKAAVADPAPTPSPPKPWAIVFADHQPVTAMFYDNKFEITFRTAQMESGTNVYPVTMNVTAVYKLERSGMGLKATREGPLKIAPPGWDPSKGRLKNEEVITVGLLRRRFGRVFKPEMQGDGLVLPGRWERAGKLALNSLNSDKGWISLGWDRPKAN